MGFGTVPPWVDWGGMKTTLFAACLVACTGTAQAVTITLGPGSNTHSSYPYLDFDNLVTPTSISGDAVLSFVIEEADLEKSHEYLEVSIDGVSLERLLTGRALSFLADAFSSLIKTCSCGRVGGPVAGRV